jgi:hypothetical protein
MKARIGLLDYDIIVSDSVEEIEPEGEGTKVYGYHDYANQTITVSPNLPIRDQRLQIIWHEIFHALECQYAQEFEHVNIYLLALYVTQILKDNSIFATADWLEQVKRENDAF